MRKQYKIELKRSEQSELEALLHKGKSSARKLNRCRLLLLSHEGKTDAQISKTLGIAPATVFNIRYRYCQEGLKEALGEKPRSGAPRKFTGREEAKVTAIACSKPPEGRSRWTLRLLADRIVELKVTDSIGYVSVRRILKKTNSSLI